MGHVTVRDFKSNTLSKFWQYGLIDWELFYECLGTVISATGYWVVFEYDENMPILKGALHLPNRNSYPDPGTYIILRPDGFPIDVALTPASARIRHPTASNTTSVQFIKNAYSTVILVSASYLVYVSLNARSVFPFQKKRTLSRFEAAHIFPRAHLDEWVEKGYQNLITDPAPLLSLGGSSKIDSVQNVILIRADLQRGWDGYSLAVNPDRGYVVIPFVPGHEDVVGKILKLDHITDPNLRPLDDLLRDHFHQCVLNKMKGEGEPRWDYDRALGDGMLDLSRSDIWGGKRGQGHLEFELAHRLHSLQVAQEL
ncbi:hypothetical protein AX14_011042 [Amanita brunnescens Koide BX004]|nr:hypothetical protein AX14_011042 [Amanita brunnescens Koide BX004]